MVIRGRSRGNGRQLGHYLIEQGRRDNDHVEVVEIRGTTATDVYNATIEMSLAAELTNGHKGLYHAQINPAIGEDHMSATEWVEAANILENKLGLDGQNRLIVLHQKLGRTHGHVVWQREKDGKLISDSHSFRAHDQARAEMELVFQHQQTRQPEKRTRSLDKEPLVVLQKENPGLHDFFAAAIGQGYNINTGAKRVRISDSFGKTAGLARVLGIKEKDARREAECFQAERERIAGERKRDLEEQLRKAREAQAMKRGGSELSR